MREYEIASNGHVKVEILDPRDNSDIEAEANEVYGIQPTAFQVSGRYEESVVSSYFDILIRYGDQNVTLSYSDLIEFIPSGGGSYDVGLRAPEYDLTRAIKKVVYGFQSIDAVFAGLSGPVKLTAYITPDTLPADYSGLPAIVSKVAKELENQAAGKFTYQEINPDAANAPVSKQTLYDTYGLRPFAASLLSEDTFYMHLVLEIADQEPQVMYPTPDMSEADIRTEIESALRRAAPGFLKTVGVWNPSEGPVMDIYGQQANPISTWTMMRAHLAQDYKVEQVDLSTGRVPGNIDVLLVVAPKGFTDKERFAIDQFLMRGGPVIVALSNYMLSQTQLGAGILMEPLQDGLADMLAHYGVSLGKGFVMDPQNEPFPMQVPRKVGNTTIAELRLIDYPFFVDVRGDGMSNKNSIVAGLAAVTLQWASPLEIDPTKNQGRQVTELLKSTKASWIRESSTVDPDLEKYPQYGFPVEGEQGSRTLAVSIRGSFESYFKDKPSPFQQTSSAEATATPDPNALQAPATPAPLIGTAQSSPSTARLVVIGSAEFVDDTVLQISQSASMERYLNNLQFLHNAVDWAVEDEDLLAIRSGGAAARLLPSLTTAQESFWEGLNYAVALIALIVIGVIWSRRRRNEKPMTLVEAKKETVKGGQK